MATFEHFEFPRSTPKETIRGELVSWADSRRRRLFDFEFRDMMFQTCKEAMQYVESNTKTQIGIAVLFTRRHCIIKKRPTFKGVKANYTNRPIYEEDIPGDFSLWSDDNAFACLDGNQKFENIEFIPADQLGNDDAEALLEALKEYQSSAHRYKLAKARLEDVLVWFKSNCHIPDGTGSLAQAAHRELVDAKEMSEKMFKAVDELNKSLKSKVYEYEVVQASEHWLVGGRMRD